MRTQATAWAASLALASLCGPLLITAEAAPAPQITPLQRPKYYFPRHVKRQFLNTTTPVIIVTPPDTTTDPDDLSSIFSSLESEGASIFTGDPTGGIPPVVIPPTTTTTDGARPDGSKTTSSDDSDFTGGFTPPFPPVDPTTTDSSSSSETGIIVGLTTAIAPTTTDDPGLPNLSSLFSSLASEISDLFPTGPTTTTDSSSSDPITTPTPTPTPTPTSTSDSGNILSSIISDLSSVISDVLPTNTGGTGPVSSIISSINSDLSSIISSIGSDISTPTTGIVPPPTSVSSLPVTSTPITTGTTDSGVFPPTTGTGPVGTGGTSTGTAVSTPTITGTGSVGGVNGTTAVPPPTSTGTAISTGSGSPTGSGSASVSVSSSTPGQSIQPTGTNTLTAEVIPSSVLVEPSTVSPSLSSSATGLPADVPQVIQPPDGMPTSAPPNTTLVQFGFEFGLNFPFVAKTKDSANQIFQFLPEGVSYGLTIPGENVVMYALRPYDTGATLGYITTLALFYIPSNMFDQLNLDKNTPVSSLYTNPDPSVFTLMSLVNPSIPLLAGDLPASGNSPTNSLGAGATNTVGPGGDGPMGNGATTNSPVVASSVGIAFAATGGVLAYGAAMFFVARRYRKKRQGHVRSSSVPTTSRDSRGSYGAVWMSGARGPGRGSPGERTSQGSGSTNSRSIRTAQISAPVMAENSLGWN